ncbi:uncharacterized protein LOC105845600 isoform X4 [Hydra vulgaris]|uniref:Uncharacterized protein LOC105845600 isoform X4 n=1 Tax=Hydra vulgaris TaxID=6087 RepID=A0ABM4CYC2_HYDVU
MKSAAPLPPSSLKSDLNENISSLINNQNIVFTSDALVYVLKEKTWSPVAESFSKICLLQTEPCTFKVVVLDVQHMLLQCVVDAFVNVKIKDTFVKWKSEKTTIGVRFTNKNTACSFYQHIENIVGIINEKNYPGEFYINLEDSNWIGFLNITNILKSELQNSSIQNLILSFVKERGGYSYLRKVNDHKMSHDILDDLNDLAGQVHAINDRSELYRFVPNTVGSASIEDGKKPSKRPAPPPPELKDLVKSEKISESNFSNKTIDTTSQNSSSPKLLNKSKRHAPSVPSSPVVSVQSISSNKNVESAKSSETFVKSIPSSPVPPIRIMNLNKNMESAKNNEAVVKSISPNPVPATRFINSKKNLESTKETEAVVKFVSLSPVVPIRKTPETLVKSPITTQSQRLVKKSSEGDKPPPLFVPPPPPQEPPPDDYSSPEDETPLLNSSTLNQVETCNACIGSNDDHNVECILNSDANDTEKDVSAISDEIYDLIPTQSNTQNNPDISFESEILSEIVEVSEQSDGDDDITCDRTVDHICCESKFDFKLVSSFSNTHQQNVESKDLFVISKKEEECRKDDSSGSVLENSGFNRKEDSSESVLENPGKNSENVMCAIEFPKNIEKIKNSSAKIPPSGLYSMLKRKSVGISDVNQSTSLDNVDDDIDKLSTLNGKTDLSSECDLERLNFLDSVRLNDKQASHIKNQVSRIDDHVKPIDINNVEFNEEFIKPTEILELKKSNNIEKHDWEDESKILPQYTNHHDSSHHDSINCTIDCEKNLHKNFSQSSNIMSHNPLTPDLVKSTVFLETTNQTPVNLLNADDKMSDLAPGSGFQIESGISEKLESLVYNHSNHNNMESSKAINHLENKIHFLNPDLYSEIDASSSTQNYNNLESCNKSENLIIDNVIQSKICNKLQHNKHVQPLQEMHKEQKSKVNSFYNPDSLVIFPDEQNEKKINLNTEKYYFDPDKVVIFPDQIPKDSEISKGSEPPNGANPWRIHALSHKSGFSKISPLSRDSSISKNSEVINTDALRLVGADVMALDEGESKDKGNDLKKSIHFEKELTSETKSKSTDNFLNNQKSSFFYNKSLSQDGDSCSLLSALPKFEENTSSFPSYTNNLQLLNDFPSKKRQTEPLKNQISLTKDYKLSIKNQTFDLRSKDQEVVQKNVPPKTLPKRKISNDKSLELRQTSNDNNVRPSEIVHISNESNVKPSELARISQLLSSKN